MKAERLENKTRVKMACDHSVDFDKGDEVQDKQPVDVTEEMIASEVAEDVKQKKPDAAAGDDALLYGEDNLKVED